MANEFVQTMSDARVDAESLQLVVNGDEDTQVTTRLGESYPAVKKAIKLMTQAGVGFTPFETKVLMQSSALDNNAYAIVTNDTTANNGLYKKKSGTWSKVTWDIDERQKSYADSAKADAIAAASTDSTAKASDAKTQAVAIATGLAADDATSKANDAKTQAVAIAVDEAATLVESLNAIVVNKADYYPLSAATRDGIISTVSGTSTTLRLFLDASVVNAKKGYLYAIKYYRNGYSVGGELPDSWAISRYKKSTYSTASVEEEIISTSDKMPEIVRDGIQTVFLKAPRSPEIIKITLDTAQLQEYGSPYNFKSAGRPMWSWIIDENCYITEPDAANPLLYNKGKNYPFVPKSKNGVVSEADPAALDIFLDIEIHNCKNDYYYSVDWFSNGYEYDEWGWDKHGWTIRRYAIADYDTSPTSEKITDNSVAQPVVLPNTGIQRIQVNTFESERESVFITIDTDALKSYGERYSWSSGAMSSWVVDPAQCYPSGITADDVRAVIDEQVESGLLVDIINNKMTVQYTSGDREYQVGLEAWGANNLPNISTVKSRVIGAQSWSDISTSPSDWLSPMGVQADSGDPAAPSLTTGGNHTGTTSEGVIYQTAKNVYFKIVVDGKETSNYKGGASSLTAFIINDLMPNNSMDYALRETYRLEFNSNGRIDVYCDRRALTNLLVYKDRGLQAVVSNLKSSHLVLDGEIVNPEAPAAYEGSGAKSIAPNAWAYIMQGSLDQICIAIDKSYGLGDGEYVKPTEQLFFFSGTKAYSAVIISEGAAMINGLSLAAGEGYQWRGSYHIKSIADKPDASYTQASTINGDVVVYNAKNYAKI